MIRFFLKLLDIIRKPKLLYKISQFNKNANFPNGKDAVTFGRTASCTNESGNKEKITIGNHCDIHASVIVQEKGEISIGNYTTIRAFSKIGAIEKITIGSHVIISNHVTIYDNNNHPTDPSLRRKMCESGFYSEMWKWKYSTHKPIVVEDNVWIGEYATILKGVTIGKGAIVAAHAVVTKDVDSFTVVAGNPARTVKYLNKS